MMSNARDHYPLPTAQCASAVETVLFIAAELSTQVMASPWEPGRPALWQLETPETISQPG